MNQAMLRMAINMIGRDKIIPAISEMIKQIMAKKDEIELQPGEENVCIMLYEVDHVAYYSFAFLNSENHIVRFEQTKKIEEFVTEMMKNF